MEIDKSKITILIVDDTPDNVSILCEYLSEYKIKIALDGKKALSILDSGVIPTVILLDIMMPEMNGYQVCTLLKQDPHTKDIPIIFITALSELKDKIRGFELGAVDYITKPFQLEEVKSRIDTHVALSLYRMQLQNMNQILEQQVEERTNELRLSRDKAEEASKLKSYFLSLLSHELRTPMVSILGFSEILTEEAENLQHKKFANGIYRATLRLKDTLESMLTFSKLQAKAQIVRPEFFNLTEHIKELTRTHILNAAVKGLQFEVNLNTNIGNVYIDKTMFDIIFNNIANNAVKFTDYGTITVDLFDEKDDATAYFCFRISDTGIGIDKDKHEIIFDEFRQVDEGMKRNFEGVGLGLSLVKKYVNLLNGKLFLESELNRGSTFTVKFIAGQENFYKTPGEIKKAIETKRCKEVYEHKPKILLVEDDPLNIEVTELFLKEIADISVAEDGNKAIESAIKNNYSAILLDINLGKGLSGIDVIKTIKSIDKYADVPIIAYTAFAMDGDEKSFLEVGCTHYLPKPCSRCELVDFVTNILQNKGAEHERKL
jgi:signal transduction histidine kinase